MNDLLSRDLNRWIWLDDLFLRLRKRNFSQGMQRTRSRIRI